MGACMCYPQLSTTKYVLPTATYKIEYGHMYVLPTATYKIEYGHMNVLPTATDSYICATDS